MRRPLTLLTLLALPLLQFACDKPAEPTATTTTTAPSATTATIYHTPQDVVAAYLTLCLSGKDDVTLPLVASAPPNLRPAVLSFEVNGQIEMRLENAIVSHFPSANIPDLLGDRSSGQYMRNSLAALPRAKIDISPDGRTATINFPNAATHTADGTTLPATLPADFQPFYCTRDGESWKVDTAKTYDITPERISQIYKDDLALIKDIDAGTVSLAQLKARCLEISLHNMNEQNTQANPPTTSSRPAP